MSTKSRVGRSDGRLSLCYLYFLLLLFASCGFRMYLPLLCIGRKDRKMKKPIKQLLIAIILIILVAVIVVGCSGDEEEPATTPDVTVEETVAEEPEMTMGEKNALASAEDYLAFTAFSHSGLIEQLEYEGYSTEEATFAADNCGADWNEQAALSAENYLDTMSFSRDGLIEQLEYEGFTHEQAVYGVEQAGY